MKTYQLLITLRGVQPKIWRRLLVDPRTTMADFHLILQTTLGWTNSHLHSFNVGRKEYAPVDFEMDGTNDYAGLKLNKLLLKEGQKMTYVYDMGDFWEHDILLEAIIQDDPAEVLPRCIAGKRSSPLEDSGGAHGYMELLKAVGNPKHPEYEEISEWAGNFDPEFFDMAMINAMLQEEEIGRASCRERV